MGKELEVPIKVTGLADLKKQLREVKSEILAISTADVVDQKKLAEATARAGALNDALGDANDQIKAMASGSAFEKIGNGLGDIGSKIGNLDFSGARDSALQFAQALTKLNPDELKKEFKTLTDTFDIVVRGFANMGSAANDATVATEANTVAAEANAVATTTEAAAIEANTVATTSNRTARIANTLIAAKNLAITVASGIATVVWTGIVNLATAAQWLWNAAISANPLVAFVQLLVLAGGAVFAFTKYLNENEKQAKASKDEIESYTTSTEKFKEAVEEANTTTEQSNRLEIARAKALGLSAKEINNIIIRQKELAASTAISDASTAWSNYTTQISITQKKESELRELQSQGVLGLFQDDTRIEQLKEEIEASKKAEKEKLAVYQDSNKKVNETITAAGETRLNIQGEYLEASRKLDAAAKKKELAAEQAHQEELIKVEREIVDEKIKNLNVGRLDAQIKAGKAELVQARATADAKFDDINKNANKELEDLKKQQKAKQKIVDDFNALVEKQAELARTKGLKEGDPEAERLASQIKAGKAAFDQAEKDLKNFEPLKAKIEKERKATIDKVTADLEEAEERINAGLAKAQQRIDKTLADGLKNTTEKQKTATIKAIREVENAKVEATLTGIEKEFAINQMAYERTLEDLAINTKLTEDVKKKYAELALLKLEEANYQTILKEGEYYQQRQAEAKKYNDDFIKQTKEFRDTILEFNDRIFEVRSSKDATDTNTNIRNARKQLKDDLLQLEEAEKAEKFLIIQRGLAEYEDVTEELAVVDKKYADAKLELTQYTEGQVLAARIEGILEFVEKSAEIVNAAFEFTKVARQEELLDLQDQKNAELDIINSQEAEQLNNLNLTEKQKQAIKEQAAKKRYEIEKKAYDREEEIRKKQFESDKQLRLIQIVINTATAISKSVAESPLTFGLPWSAFAAALGAIQFATVLQTKYHSTTAPPKLDSGGGFGSGGSGSGDENKNLTPNQTVLVGKQFELNEVTGGRQPSETGKSAITVKAIVVESDITGTQTQIKHIENLSELGG